ncbi:unnamed protein product [Sphagnum jensenii]|uniref:Secreted protein n=1 Tax=Sphagnum jensenii TaxID=128206 RepID=A0ABP0WYT5_9BRYO
MTMPSWVRLLIMDGLLQAVFLMSPRVAVPAPEPSPSPLCCRCSRSLLTNFWGFAFAFGGLTLDACTRRMHMTNALRRSERSCIMWFPLAQSLYLRICWRCSMIWVHTEF